MLRIKLKAGALQMTLFLIVVIALILTAFIILVHTQKLFKIQTDFIIETAQNTNKGIHYALNNTVKLNDTSNIDLNDEDYKNLKVFREYWGIYEKVLVSSEIKTNRFQKVAFIGAYQNEINRTALYLQDNNKPLVLVGNTKIEGLAYLPLQGVKPGTISGQSYYGSSLIYGQTRTSSSLPKLSSESLRHLKNIERSISQISSKQYLNLEYGKPYSNSFLKPIQIISSTSEIRLAYTNLTGNIIVKSNTKIVVESTAILKDILLIAPQIEIKENVKGNFQAIASEQISVEKNVHLDYPSAFVLMEKQTNEQEGSLNQINIDSNSTIKGQIIFQGKPKPNNYEPQIVIENDTNIIGEVYCSGNLELKGTVIGSVFTSNFVANQFGSIYQNHIYNGEILVNELSEEYIGLLFNDSKKGVLKWLY